MAAVRVSKTIICIDVEVPSPDSSEVVKALAKQVVAYCLRNMERLSLADAGASAAVAALTKPYEGTDKDEITVPDVLLHLVGHVDGFHENHDNDDPAPDTDYIVGGTGVVKALQYCLGDEANQFRRGSGLGSGATTPLDRDQEAGKEIERKGKAKEMSKNLLGSARKIRTRLQPALLKEAVTGDEMAYSTLFADDVFVFTFLMNCRTTPLLRSDSTRNDTAIRRRISRNTPGTAFTENRCINCINSQRSRIASIVYINV